MAKITLDQIKQEIEQDGWKIHSLEYKNLETEMSFECNNGHNVFAPFSKQIKSYRSQKVRQEYLPSTRQQKLLAIPYLIMEN